MYESRPGAETLYECLYTLAKPHRSFVDGTGVKP